VGTLFALLACGSTRSSSDASTGDAGADSVADDAGFADDATADVTAPFYATRLFVNANWGGCGGEGAEPRLMILGWNNVDALSSPRSPDFSVAVSGLGLLSMNLGVVSQRLFAEVGYHMIPVPAATWPSPLDAGLVGPELRVNRLLRYDPVTDWVFARNGIFTNGATLTGDATPWTWVTGGPVVDMVADNVSDRLFIVQGQDVSFTPHLSTQAGPLGPFFALSLPPDQYSAQAVFADAEHLYVATDPRWPTTDGALAAYGQAQLQAGMLPDVVVPLLGGGKARVGDLANDVLAVSTENFIAVFPSAKAISSQSSFARIPGPTSRLRLSRKTNTLYRFDGDNVEIWDNITTAPVLRATLATGNVTWCANLGLEIYEP